MAISRMQQPRQMYGLGSFVKKAVRKITRPVTKVASKIVPKEIAGIMRAAAPFLPGGFREAAYLLGTAKQTGRISPMDLALTAAPTFFSKTNVGQGIADRVGNLTLPGMDRNLRQVMVGTPEITSRGPKTFNIPDPVRSPVQPGQITKTLPGFGDPRTVEATSGIFGKGGEFFQFGKEGGPRILDTKAGQTLFGKKNEDGTFSPSVSKLAGVGIGTLSLLTAAKTPEEAGETLVSATGDPDDYERGAALFSQLTPDLFAVPERFRLTAADGGLMRTNYAQGTQGASELKSLMEGMRANNSRSYGPEELKNLFAGMRPEEPDFFEDLFLKREGGGGRDFMIPERAADFRKYYKDDGGFGVLDAPEGVNIFTSADQAKKMNLDMAKELEAERILPSLNAMYSSVIDKILDIDDEETKQKMMDDVNSSFDKTEGSGFQKAANAYYRIIQKYGYLLDDKKRGLGNFMEDPSNKANGGLMRTNYAFGSDDKGPVLPSDEDPINPFGPKPTGPVLPNKGLMASDDVNERFLEQLYEQLLEEGFSPEEAAKKARELFDQMSKVKDKKGIMMAKKGGRANLALGSRPTAEESGLGGLPIEADMRYTGGFMPYGAKEKADDVPARLSKNEFVFTADAVRAAGGGSVNKGAKRMYQTMKQLEAKPEAKGMMA